MAELLIAAAEEYKCINEEKLSASGDFSGSGERRDQIDSDVGPPPRGMCVCVRAHVCASMCMCAAGVHVRIVPVCVTKAALAGKL